MPNVKLPTGVDFYYESHGNGSRRSSCRRRLIRRGGGSLGRPLAKSLQLNFHDPRGCGRSVPTQSVYTIEQMALDSRRDDRAFENCRGQFTSATPWAGESHFRWRKTSRQSKEPDYGGERFRHRWTGGFSCVPVLPHRLVYDMVDMGFEKFIYDEIVESDTFFTEDFRRRTAPGRSVLRSSLGDPREARTVSSPVHRARTASEWARRLAMSRRRHWC